MSDALPSIAGDIPTGSGPEPSPQAPSPGRVLKMRPSDSTADALDDRLSEVIDEVQNGSSGWQRFENQLFDTWQQVSSQASALYEDLSIQVRRTSKERPLYVIGVVTLASFFIGAVLRATRSRYE